MKEFLIRLPGMARDKYPGNRKFFGKLRKRPPKHLDQMMVELHNETFRKTNCLDCANCCRTTGPLFTTADIERIARFLRLKPQKFIREYLKIDEDKDYVLQQVPCAFLGPDNRCAIYEVRPKACSEYPHTNRKKFHQISELTLKNVSICPAAFSIVEEMKRRIPLK